MTFRRDRFIFHHWEMAVHSLLRNNCINPILFFISGFCVLLAVEQILVTDRCLISCCLQYLSHLFSQSPSDFRNKVNWVPHCICPTSFYRNKQKTLNSSDYLRQDTQVTTHFISTCIFLLARNILWTQQISMTHLVDINHRKGRKDNHSHSIIFF